MSAITVAPSNYTRAGQTCRAAMGFSFAAGTTDGAPCHSVSPQYLHGSLDWTIIFPEEGLLS